MRRWQNDHLEGSLEDADGRKAADALRKAKEKAHLYRDIVNFTELSAHDPWKRLAQDEKLRTVRDYFLQGALPVTTTVPTRRPPAVTARERLFRIDGRLRRVVTKACSNSLPAARVVLTLETFVRSVYNDTIVPPPGQWWATLLREAPVVVTRKAATTTTTSIQFLFDGKSPTGGFHRLLLHAVCQYHGLAAVSQTVHTHRALMVTGQTCAPDTLLAQLIEDASQLALLEEPWTLVGDETDLSQSSTTSPAVRRKDKVPENSNNDHPETVAPDFLTPEQVATFQRDGVLVVDGFLSSAQLEEVHKGLACTLRQHGVDTNDLSSTGHKLATLSSTGGSGGVLDVFYQDWQLDIALDSQLLTWTQQLWKAMYINNENCKLEELSPEQRYQWHPYGAWEPDKAYAYLDRICYRLPTALSNELGLKQAKARPVDDNEHPLTAKQKKKCTLQRSLTPHLDCCPDTYDTATGKVKWRPIQCFVSLTDNTEPNMGGFEVAKGFHHEFRTWTQQRIGSTSADGTVVPPPCIGEYTHIRPTEDKAVMERVQHVPVRAGSVVFWDNRLPHANAYRHNGSVPRVVVYCSFLPYVDLNRRYAENQLAQWRLGHNPTDQWITSSGRDNVSPENPLDLALDGKRATELAAKLASLSPLAQQLLAMKKW